MWLEFMPSLSTHAWADKIFWPVFPVTWEGFSTALTTLFTTQCLTWACNVHHCSSSHCLELFVFSYLLWLDICVHLRITSEVIIPQQLGMRSWEYFIEALSHTMKEALPQKKLLNLLLEVHWVCNNFIVPCKCATWELLIYDRRLDSDPVTHIIILPLVKAIPQAIPLFLLPLFPSVAMKRILLGIQNPQGKFCAQKPLARHTPLRRAQHKHYNTGAPGTPRISPISPQMHQASFCKSNILTESW